MNHAFIPMLIAAFDVVYCRRLNSILKLFLTDCHRHIIVAPCIYISDSYECLTTC